MGLQLLALIASSGTRMLSLLSEFLQPWADLIPRFSHRPTSVEWCIWDSVIFGPRVTRWPILHCPALSHIEYYPSTPFPIDLEVQTLRTADGHELTINASIMVTILDPLVLRSSIGYDDYINNLSMDARAVIHEFISGHNMSYGLESTERLSDHLWDSLSLLTENGVSLDRLCIEDAAATTAFRLYGISAAL